MAGGAQGLPRVLRARWMPTIKTWMDMGRIVQGPDRRGKSGDIRLILA